MLEQPTEDTTAPPPTEEKEEKTTLQKIATVFYYIGIVVGLFILLPFIGFVGIALLQSATNP